MDSQRRLEEIFTHFPGIGPRQARRFVYHLLNKSAASIKEFTDLVQEVKRSTSECDSCHRIFMHKKAGDRLCTVCSDSTRDRSTLMIVARDSDYESIEKSGAYRGLYFILGGTVPVLDKEPEKRIRLKLLLQKISDSASLLKEVILSLNTTPDGEHTADTVKDALTSRGAARQDSSDRSFYLGKITVLGRGLSTGAELEYVDGETIKNALQNRH